MSLAAPPRSPSARFWQDARRMLPVWLIVSAAAIASLAMIHTKGTSALRTGVLNGADACVQAEVQLNAAMPRWQAVAARALNDRGAARQGSTLGVLKDDGALRELIAQLEGAAQLCPSLAGVQQLLADASWWNGDAAGSHYHLALDHMRLGELEFAATEIRAAIDAAPSDPRIAAAAIDLAIKRKDWAEAEKLLAQSPQIVRESASSDWARGYLAYIYGNNAEARRLMESALSREPGRPDWMSALLDVYWADGDFEKGGDWLLENARRAATPEGTAFHRAAMLYLRGEKWAKAHGALDLALAIQPNNIAMRVQRALCEFKLGHTQAARASLDDAFNRNAVEYRRLMETEEFQAIRDLRPR